MVLVGTMTVGMTFSFYVFLTAFFAVLVGVLAARSRARAEA